MYSIHLQNVTQSALNLISWQKFLTRNRNLGLNLNLELVLVFQVRLALWLWSGICIKAKSKASTKIIRVDIFNGRRTRWGRGSERGRSLRHFTKVWTGPVELSACIFMTYASFDDRCTCLCLQLVCVTVRVCVCVCVFVLNQLSLPVDKLCPARQQIELSPKSHFELW